MSEENSIDLTSDSEGGTNSSNGSRRNKLFKTDVFELPSTNKILAKLFSMNNSNDRRQFVTNNITDIQNELKKVFEQKFKDNLGKNEFKTKIAVEIFDKIKLNSTTFNIDYNALRIEFQVSDKEMLLQISIHEYYDKSFGVEIIYLGFYEIPEMNDDEFEDSSEEEDNFMNNTTYTPTEAAALEILGLDRTKNYTAKEIKKAYRKMSLENHPDKGGTNDKQVKINRAYDTLKDLIKRRFTMVKTKFKF